MLCPCAKRGLMTGARRASPLGKGGGVRPGEGRCRCAVVVWPAEIYRCAGKAVVGWGLSGECQGHRPVVEAFRQGGWGRELTHETRSGQDLYE